MCHFAFAAWRSRKLIENEGTERLVQYRPPKIVVIGAGSAIFGLGALSTILQYPAMKGAELALCDINAEGLSVIHQLAEKMNRAWDAEIRITSSTERRDLLPEADFVLVSIQVGQREDVWELDWRIPLRHGVRQPYAENGGPGAFAHTARNLPLIMAIARDMEALCPDAWYLNLVNPLIRLTTAVHRYSKIKVVGLCHQLLWGLCDGGDGTGGSLGYTGAGRFPRSHGCFQQNGIPVCGAGSGRTS